MARPRNEHPTPAELEVLHVLWEEGPKTVRGVKDTLDTHRPRAYTTVMTVMDTVSSTSVNPRRQVVRILVGVLVMVCRRSTWVPWASVSLPVSS